MMSAEDRQLELEEEMRGLGASRYLKSMTKQEEIMLPPGIQMLRKSVMPMVGALSGWITEVRGGQARRYASYANLIEEAGVEAVAYIAMRRAINAISMRQKTTSLAIELGGDLKEELEYRDFKAAEPYLYKAVVKDMDKVSSERHRVVVLGLARRRAGIPDREIDKEARLSIGIKLLELVQQATGLIEMVTITEGKNRTVSMVMGTEEARQWLEKQHDYCQILSPLFLPMLCQPRDWETPKLGGYLTTKLDLIKTPNKAYLSELEAVEMPVVYGAINAMQRTGWRINQRVLTTMEALWNLGGDRAKLPPKEGRNLPPKPTDINTNEESRREWKKAAKPVYQWNARNMSKVVSVAQKLWVANKFKDQAEFFYVWTMDWRGRAYPVGTFVHPQSDDSGKALLEFSVGKPLGDTGAAWLKVHLANTWGNDKVSFDDRIQWAEDNAAMILRCGMDPLVNREWMDAGSPFGFLAACFDFLGYKMNGPDHISHLPVQVDGSCNGLQNFSAMLLDEIGGRATNLIPSEKPKDIYGLVAEQANLLAQEDYCVHSIPEAEVFAGKITRGLTKRNTMTMPYSVTQYGMKDQLMEEFRKMADEGKSWDFLGNDEFKCATYLAGINYKAIGKVVVAARNAMDWLKAVAKVVSSDALPVIWTNPAGLPIVQSYQEIQGHRVQVMVGGKRQLFTINREGQKLDTRKQAAGIAPNFVHSCDSGHMMRTVVKCWEAGIDSFSFIHDSFGTHACDMTDLSCFLREAFVEQYEGNVLEKFREEIVEQLTRSGSTELVEKLPPIPPKGSLDLQAVKHSEYFFA
jgi:DNA-directed RNA polymerase, mitochondrial